jgi:acyl-coenzyme A synthetase/AMP-(fatty) acid ligase
MSGSVRLHPVVEGVRQSCVRHPSATAITGVGGTWSYADVIRELDTAVRTFRDAGVSAGHVVSVRAARVGLLPVGLLAVWQVGATAAIVDATLPAARVDECEQVVEPDWQLALDGPEPFTLTMTREETDRTAPVAGGARSHILFTSGTTGRPTAVAVSHGAIERTLDWYAHAFSPGPQDRVGMLAGLGHDPMLRDTFVPLLCGGVLAVPAPDVFAGPDRLLSFIGSAGLTILHCTPGLLEVILAAHAVDTRSLGSLRLVVSGGATLSLGTVRRLRGACGAVVVNAYGSTETPQIASCEIVSETLGRYDPGLPDDAPVGIGNGVGGAELLLSDLASAGTATPPGTAMTATAIGEIVVRSPNLATGYLAGTGDRFLPDPFGVPGFRAYRTGDLGRRGDDGSIRVVGRLDRQMSINGHRVAPEEIERTALRHPAVVRAVAGPVSSEGGDLIGLTVVLTSPGATDARALRSFLRERLPRPAVPTRVRIVPELALNHNHKVSHRQ